MSAKNDFSELSENDAVRLVVNTAITVSQSVDGVKVVSNNGNTIILIVGYEYKNKDIIKAQQ